jgi:hypothetical protein
VGVALLSARLNPAPAHALDGRVEMSKSTYVMPGPVELEDGEIDAVTGGVKTQGCVIGTNGQTALQEQLAFRITSLPNPEKMLPGLLTAGAGTGCTCILEGTCQG